MIYSTVDTAGTLRRRLPGVKSAIALLFLWLLYSPVPAAVPELWVVDPAGLASSEQALLASLQGILNRSNAVMWLRGRGESTRVLEELRTEGWRLHSDLDLWRALERFRPELQGFIACSISNASLNVATSLAGSRQAVVADRSLRPRLHALGLPELLDVSTLDERAAWAQYRSEFRSGIAIHQPIAKPLHLRDFAVAHRAFTFFDVPASDCTRWVHELGPRTRVFGWGQDEHRFITEVSAGGGVVIPADWALNLSALPHLRTPLPPRPHRPTPAPLRPAERAVAFVVTDGDNLQWLLNGFVDAPGFWASPQRGHFPVTWELAPALAELAPRVCAHLFRTATTNDDFVAGPSGAGYWFPSQSPARTETAVASGRALPLAQLSAISVLNSGGGLDAADELVGQPQVAGVLYKDYSPYHKWRGAVRWSGGKPIVSYRQILWEQRQPDGTLRPDWLPAGVADAIRNRPTGQARSGASLAVVNVHAWSFRDSGGPMGAIARTIDLLPAGTRIVSVTELFEMLQSAPADSSAPQK